MHRAIPRYARLLNRVWGVFLLCVPLGPGTQCPCPTTFETKLVLELLEQQDDLSKECLARMREIADSEPKRKFLDAALRAWGTVFEEDKPPVLWATDLDPAECVNVTCKVRFWYVAVVRVRVSRYGELLSYTVLREAPPDECYRRCIESYVHAGWYRPAVRRGRFVEGEGTVMVTLEGRPR